MVRIFTHFLLEIGKVFLQSPPPLEGNDGNNIVLTTDLYNGRRGLELRFSGRLPLMNTSELNFSRLPLVETSSETRSLALFGTKISSLPGPSFPNWPGLIKEPLIKASSVVILFPHPLARPKVPFAHFFKP